MPSDTPTTRDEDVALADELSANVREALVEVCVTLELVAQRFNNLNRPISGDIYDQFSHQLMGMIENAQQLCQLAGMAAMAQTSDPSNALAAAYLIQVDLLASLRSHFRTILLRHRPHLDMDPALHELLSELTNARVKVQ